MLNFLWSFLAGAESDKLGKRFYSDLTPVSDAVLNRRPVEDNGPVLHKWEIRECVRKALAELDGAQVSNYQRL